MTSLAGCNRGKDWGEQARSASPIAQLGQEAKVLTPGSVGRMAARFEERIAEERSRSVERRRSPSPSPLV